ncbi:hypothetical protein [Streptomyces sp. V1I1]|uniref:hypothetical protein n=1 Tax=Streptomyces sp. V1I1 TaxID=3042272 RepID=UPI0027823C8D|nr:hypothetical protein [Streptomyces sp. V1I1]MDQ0938851.1 hypothetical protein [Streptomyces sp. V1I1]
MEELLEDREQSHAQTEDIIATYLSGDVTGGWAKFFAQANITLPEGACEAMFGGERDPQQVADERRWFEHELRATVRWQPDLSALRSASTRIVVGIGIGIGIGNDSAGQVCDRPSKALAAALGIEPTMFPGDHTGFAEDPDRFAAQLRTVLRANQVRMAGCRCESQRFGSAPGHRAAVANAGFLSGVVCPTPPRLPGKPSPAHGGAGEEPIDTPGDRSK